MKTTKFWLTAIAVLLCSVAMNAEVVFTVDGIEYTVASTDGTCSVSGYDESLGTEVVIPSSVDYRNRTFSVTSIGNNAFSLCSSLTSITLPEGVTSIGSAAFYKCSSLASIIIPKGVTSIGNGAFADCSSLASITIPESVTSIGDRAFDDCTSLKEVAFEDGSETLILGCNYHDYWVDAMDLFSDCPLEHVYWGRNISYSSDDDGYLSPCFEKDKLTSVTIGKNVTFIEAFAFKGCCSLTSIIIPENSQLTSIGYYVFYGCSNLTTITIPESVTSIGYYVFYGCSNLTTITIPESVTSIGNNAFDNSSIKHATFYCAHIGRCFGENTALKEVVLGESVRSIGYAAFERCSSLASIIIPENSQLTSIDAYAFADCSSLASITFPESVTSIAYGAFSGCSSLTSISCLGIIPPTIAKSTFDSDAYNFADLFVPQGTKDAYQTATGWKDFWLIKEFDPDTAISPSTIENNPSTVIYNLNGRRELDTENLKGGIYIVNGKKVIIND